MVCVEFLLQSDYTSDQLEHKLLSFGIAASWGVEILSKNF